MTKFQTTHYDFSRGEAPEIAHRPDVSFYYQAAAVMENLRPRVFGGARVRGGYALATALPFSNTEVRGFAFQDSRGKEWLIWLVPGRAYAVATDTATVDADFAVPYAAGELRFISHAQRGDRLILAHGNHPLSNIEYHGSHWAFSHVPLTNTPTESGGSVWSPSRGYPRYVALWRGRMVLGGTRTQPANYWMSRTYNYFDFERKTDSTNNNEGTLLDDAAVFGSLSGEGGPVISNIIADDNLYIVSTRGVFAYSSKTAPTPLNFNLINYDSDLRTRRGSPRPVKIDGNLIIVTGTPATRLESLMFDKDFDHFQRNNISLLSPQRGENPIAMSESYGLPDDGASNMLYVLRQDGQIGVWLTEQSQKIAAWVGEKIEGEVLAAAVSAQKLWLIARHDNKNYLLVQSHHPLDYAVTQTVENITADWTVPEALRGKQGLVAYSVLGEKKAVPTDATQVTFDEAITLVDFGFDFQWQLRTLPLAADQQGAAIDQTFKRARKVAALVKNTTGFSVNGKRIDLAVIDKARLSAPFELQNQIVEIAQGTNWQSPKDGLGVSIEFSGAGTDAFWLQKLIIEAEVSRE